MEEELMKNNQSNRIDKGFQLSYWKLSYRRKFMRTLWTIPFSIAVILVYFYRSHSFHSERLAAAAPVVLAGLLTVITLVQLVYTYIRWKRGD